MTFPMNIFHKSLLEIFGVRAPKRLALAVSGGVDSMALTGLMTSWAQSRNVELRAFIVDHNLRKESTDEAQSVAAYIESRFRVPSSILTLTGVDPAAGNVEELARNGRRAVLSRACSEGGYHHLLLGHHLNDQIELFILRLLSGSSWFGLAGMLPKSPMNMVHRPGVEPLQLVRPFLKIPKAALKQWCVDQSVRWWEDPTNQDTTLTERNLIRKLYENGEVSAAFSEENVESLLDLLGNQRQEVRDIAGSVLQQLQISRQYRPQEFWKSSKLMLSRALSDLPPAVLTEILLRIIAPLSPKSEDTIVKKRRSIKELVDQLKSPPKELKSNVLGVMITGNEKRWLFNREPLRRADSARLEVFRATERWSDFTLIDNRWFFRWRLAPKAEDNGSDSRSKRSKLQTRPSFFSVSFLSDPNAVFKPLSSALPAHEVNKIKNNVSTHPFFMWSDAADPHTITVDKIIGFPTLGILAKGLEVEVQPKLCAF